MKRVFSTVITALVAVSFAGMVWAADSTGTGTVMPLAGEGTGMSTGGESGQGSAGTQTRNAKKKKKKKKKSKKSRKSTRRSAGTGVTGTQPDYGTPAMDGPGGAGR